MISELEEFRNCLPAFATALSAHLIRDAASLHSRTAALPKGSVLATEVLVDGQQVTFLIKSIN